MSILAWVILGTIAGWLASMIMRSPQGLATDVVLGILGAFVGGFVLTFFGQGGVSGLNVYSLIISIFGAVILIALGRTLRQA